MMRLEQRVWYASARNGFVTQPVSSSLQPRHRCASDSYLRPLVDRYVLLCLCVVLRDLWQLPATFQATDGTNKDGGVFNDQNKPEADRFTPLERCTYFVDLELADQTEEKMSQNDDWHVLTDLPFLDASKSRSPYRALFIPFLSSKHTVFARYLVLKRKH